MAWRAPLSQDFEHSGELRSARSFCTDIAPHWDDRFAALLFRRPLPQNQPSRALDIHCAHGQTTLQLLRGLHPESQVLALQADPNLLSIAQGNLLSHKQQVQLRGGNFDEITTLPEGHFDVVCANLVLGQAVPDWELGLAELYRILAPGGQARATLAIRGTWHDATQIALNVFADNQANWAHEQLRLLEQTWPTPHTLLERLRSLAPDPGDSDLNIERFETLFSSARDFFSAPLVEQGPLALWRALLRRHPNPRNMLWQLREAFDAHYENHILALPVVAAVATLRKPKNKRKRKALGQDSLSAYPQLRRLCYGSRPAESKLQPPSDQEPSE